MTSEAPPSGVTRGHVMGLSSPTMPTAHSLRSASQPASPRRKARRKGSDPVTLGLSPASGYRPGKEWVWIWAWDWENVEGTHSSLCQPSDTMGPVPGVLEEQRPQAGPCQTGSGTTDNSQLHSGHPILQPGESYLTICPPPPHPGQATQVRACHRPALTGLGHWWVILSTSDTQDLLKSQPSWPSSFWNR